MGIECFDRLLNEATQQIFDSTCRLFMVCKNFFRSFTIVFMLNGTNVPMKMAMNCPIPLEIPSRKRPSHLMLMAQNLWAFTFVPSHSIDEEVSSTFFRNLNFDKI